MLRVLHFKTTLNSWPCSYRKAQCRVVAGICCSQRCCLPNCLRVLLQVVTEAEVPARCHSHRRQRASSWPRSLYLADQTVPTPKYTVTNCCLFVYAFIFCLPCGVFPQAKPSPWGKWRLVPGPLVSSCTRTPRVLGSIQLGFASRLPPCVTSWALSGLIFNHSWCGLSGFFHASETLQVFLVPQNTFAIFKSSPETHIFCCVLHPSPHERSFWLYLYNKSRCWPTWGVLGKHGRSHSFFLYQEEL